MKYQQQKKRFNHKQKSWCQTVSESQFWVEALLNPQLKMFKNKLQFL